MNILLLSNSAPNYFHFFNALARLFAEDGAAVAIAVDSRFSRAENGLDALGFPVHGFEAFCRTHETDPAILRRYAGYPLNAALLSDFERASVYGIWGQTDIAFFDRLKSALLTFYEELFTRYQPDIVLYENVSNSFAQFALFVAQEKGARYLGLGASRLPGRFSVSGDPLHDDATAKIFAAIRTGEVSVDRCVRGWARDYIARIETIVPDYMKINGLDNIGILKRYFRPDRLQKVAALARHAFDKRQDAFQIGNPLLTHARLFGRNVGRRFRAPRVRRFYGTPVAGEKFLLYPLHFHPESSTSILAGSYLDEYEVIRNIAFSLPEGLRLYVKDHMSAFGYPALATYRRLASLPNVRLLPPEAPTKQLIREAAAVITLTSTVGYEALLLGKRVFLYGQVFYDFHKGVTRIENPSALRELLLTHLDRPTDWDARYNEDFVSAYFLATLPGRLNLLQKGEAAQETARQIYAELRRSAYLPSPSSA